MEKIIGMIAEKLGISDEEEKKYEGYFTNLESALRFIRDQMTAEALSADMFLPQAIAAVREVNAEFTEAFRRATGNAHGR